MDNDRLEIQKRHQKIHVTLVTILSFFERAYVLPH